MQIRKVLLLALFGMMVGSQPFNSQSIKAVSSDPIIVTDQAQWPPPPECGLYDTCHDKKK
jgi:hypothetical protein